MGATPSPVVGQALVACAPFAGAAPRRRLRHVRRAAPAQRGHRALGVCRPRGLHHLEFLMCQQAPADSTSKKGSSVLGDLWDTLALACALHVLPSCACRAIDKDVLTRGGILPGEICLSSVGCWLRQYGSSADVCRACTRVSCPFEARRR